MLSNKCDNVWKCIILPLLFAKLTCIVYLNHSIHLNVTHHRYFIGFRTFILATTTSSHDVIIINVLMNSLVLACKWSIGRLQVEKCVSLFFQAQNVTYFLVHDMNQYMVKLSTNLLSYTLDNDFSSSCFGKSLPKNMHISLNMKPFWLIWKTIVQ